MTLNQKWKLLAWIAAAAALGWAAWRGTRIAGLPERLSGPNAAPPGKLGQEIGAFNDRQEALRVVAFYKRVQSQLAAARSQGFDVSLLERRVEAAMQLNDPPYRRQALERLSQIEMDIPRRAVQYIPLYAPPKPPARLRSRPARRSAKSARRRHSARKRTPAKRPR